MAKEENKLEQYFQGSLNTCRGAIQNLLNNRRQTLNSLLGEVNGKQLWKLVEILRDTKYWHDFLVALLRLPPEAWKDRELIPENAEDHFTIKEKALICGIYLTMTTEGHHSPILVFLGK